MSDYSKTLDIMLELIRVIKDERKRADQASQHATYLMEEVERLKSRLSRENSGE